MAQMLLEASNIAKVGRQTRKPQHQFHLRSRAFQIQPFMIAPVLAGETMKNLLMQSRVVTDPIKNPLIGWHKEYYFFYVKLTDIDYDYGSGSDMPGAGNNVGDLVKMLLGDPAWDKTAHDYGSAVESSYAVATSQTFMDDCLNAVVRHYFRDAEDAGTSYLLDGVPLASIGYQGILDSAITNDAYLHAQTTVDVDLLGDASDAVLNVSEVDEALRRYQWARQNGLTDATYEDYLASFGIATKPERPHVPELLRYAKAWQYPSNTVEPSTGVPSSAVSWSIQERADKDRFFKEPGFVFGCTVTRPKVYISNQKSYMAGWLDRAEDWLPAALWGDTLSTMKKFAQGSGPFSSLSDSDGYWLDMRDLYIYGDQFVNFALTETDAGLVALPTAGLNNKKFPSDTDIDALFVTPATKQFIREDGVVALTILGSQRDYTATT